MKARSGQDQSAEGRRSKEKTIEAILDAAEALFARGGYEGVTVRDIARAAGITHPLVHLYVGSKEDVYKAVLLRDQERILRAIGDAPDLRTALPRAIAEILGPSRPYATLLAHTAIHGLPWNAEVQGFAVRRLLELRQADEADEAGRALVDGLDPRFPVAAVVALVLGWISVQTWLAQAAGLELDDNQVGIGITAMALRMLGLEEDAR